ncbi:MAG: nucleoside-diphosphate kinase [Bacteroidales bacterium]
MKHTLAIIKPHAVRDNKTGAILSKLIEAGFRIAALKMTKLTKLQTSEFYKEHEGKYFYEPLVDMMSSGPVVLVILEKENAVSDLRTLVGNTDPEKAAPETLRKIFGISMRENAVHASDGDQKAAIECGYFFSQIERF